MKDTNQFRRKAIEQILEKTKLSAAQQRRLWARVGTAKRFLLQTIAPELLELRARHDALEMLVIDHLQEHHQDEVFLEERLEGLRKKALEDLPEDDKLYHLASVKDPLWRWVEDRMLQDIKNKQREPLLKSAGVEGT